MNKIIKGKKQLSAFGIVLIVASCVLMILGVLGIVFGLNGGDIRFVLFILGMLGVLLSLGSVIYGVAFVWTSSALTSVEGNVEEDNEYATNTLGADRCDKCGEKLDEKGECVNHKIEE